MAIAVSLRSGCFVRSIYSASVESFSNIMFCVCSRPSLPIRYDCPLSSERCDDSVNHLYDYRIPLPTPHHARPGILNSSSITRREQCAIINSTQTPILPRNPPSISPIIAPSIHSSLNSRSKSPPYLARPARLASHTRHHM